MVELAPPVSVSPFIRACRWGFLTAGIFYGAFHYRRLSRKEAKVREYEAKQMEMLKDKREAERQLNSSCILGHLCYTKSPGDGRELVFSKLP
uniref:ATP synthase F(0) complex subunit e, mitochondrial n=1 Tax=Amblyomma maculatum TaxID=34609 RepID=G3MRV9_AMBMU